LTMSELLALTARFPVRGPSWVPRGVRRVPLWLSVRLYEASEWCKTVWGMGRSPMANVGRDTRPTKHP
jgi:hypothetical protein